MEEASIAFGIIIFFYIVAEVGQALLLN